MRTPTDMLCLRAGNRSLLIHLPSWRWLALLAMVLLALALLALSVGGGKLGLVGVLNTLLGEGTRLEQLTLFKIRLPRILGVVVAGAAMGLSGCLVQTLVRNRLATPDMVGVN
ncbi:MAG: iron chelate uptake ABC transporter family permease subunit, partial [Aeromonas veronii]